MFHDRIIKRIPGIIPPISTNEKQGHLDDITAIPSPQLLDLIARQEKLLSNKTFISNLPDKGEKIKTFFNTLKEEQTRRNEIENVTGAFESLKIGSDDVEWSDISNTNNSNEDGFKKNILYGENTRSAKEDNIQRLKKMSNSVTSTTEDVKKIGEAPYVKHVIQKVEKPDSKKQERFKPNVRKKASKDNEKRHISHKIESKWEVTAATPPPPVYSDVKILTLEESIALQKEQLLRLKEAQVKQAQERLAEQCSSIGSGLPVEDGQMEYRQRQEISSDTSDSESGDEEKQMYEEEEEERENDVAVIVSLVDG